MSGDEGPVNTAEEAPDSASRRPRPVFDPALPADVAPLLRRHPQRLWPADRPPDRWPTSRRSQLAGGVAVAVLAAGIALLGFLLDPAAIALLVVVTLTGGVLIGLVVEALISGSWPLGVPLGVFGVGAGALELTRRLPDLLLTHGIVTATGVGGENILSAALAVMVGGITVAVMTRRRMVRLLAALHHERYLIPADFADDETVETTVGDRGSEEHDDTAAAPEDTTEPWRPTFETETLTRMQGAIDRIRESADTLGAPFTDHAGMALLAEREWHLAQRLLRHRRLRNNLERQRDQAASERVLEALRPYQEALRVSAETITSQVAAIVDYDDRLRAAVLAQREWEQCQEIIRRHDDYADLIASSEVDPATRDAWEREVARARTAHQVRDERTHEALAAAQWLSEIPVPPAAHPPEGS